MVPLEALSEAEREDGVFPLLTNDRTLSTPEILRAYKRQPLLEKRFSQLKTDFAVAPVYLKNVSRIQGLVTQLTKLQRSIVHLLGLAPRTYGLA